MDSGWMELVANLLSALGGALAGSFFAFRLEARTKTLDERARLVSEGRKALFHLVEQRTILANVEQQHLARLRLVDQDSAWMCAAVAGIPRRPIVDVNSLTFLLDRKYGELLNEISVGQSHFEEFLFLVDERSRFNSEFQRLVEPHIAGATVLPERAEMERLAGPRLTAILKGITEALQDAAKDSLDWNSANEKALRTALQVIFPNTAFASFVDLRAGVSASAKSA